MQITPYAPALVIMYLFTVVYWRSVRTHLDGVGITDLVGMKGALIEVTGDRMTRESVDLRRGELFKGGSLKWLSAGQLLPLLLPDVASGRCEWAEKLLLDFCLLSLQDLSDLFGLCLDGFSIHTKIRTL